MTVLMSVWLSQMPPFLLPPSVLFLDLVGIPVSSSRIMAFFFSFFFFFVSVSPSFLVATTLCYHFPRILVFFCFREVREKRQGRIFSHCHSLLSSIYLVGNFFMNLVSSQWDQLWGKSLPKKCYASLHSLPSDSTSLSMVLTQLLLV